MTTTNGNGTAPVNRFIQHHHERQLAAPDDEVVMTAQEVGAMLRLRPSTVADLARRGDLACLMLGRHRRYLRSDVLAFMQAQRRA